jgi:heme oxygenase (biliverdin-producing, ferredoxin)
VSTDGPATTRSLHAQREHGSFADALRERTRTLHAEAERSGIVLDILRGRVSRSAYALYLRNILPAYQHLEAGLERHRDRAALQGIARPEVYRAEGLQADLEALCGADYAGTLPLVAAAEQYAAHLADVADDRAEALVAHAYTRFLGDLNGGRMMRSILARSFVAEPLPLQFHSFPGIADLAVFTAQYRAAFDIAATHLARPEAVLREAELAFRLNIELSMQVQSAASLAEEVSGSA